MNLRTAPQRGVNFDYIMWLFTRLSALGMYLLAFIGFTGALTVRVPSGNISNLPPACNSAAARRTIPLAESFRT